MHMSPLVGTILIFALLFFAVWLSDKIKVNMGLISLAFALIVGCVVLGLTPNQVFARFPITITMTFILGPAFFGYVRRTGVFDKLSQSIVYLLRGAPALYPFAVFIASTVLTACGGVLVSGLIIGSFAYPVAKKLRCNPLLIGIALWGGCFVFPWLDTSSVGLSLIAQFDEALVAPGGIALMMAGFPQRLGFLLLAWLVLKGYKVDASEIVFAPAEPYNATEKKGLYLVLGFVVFAAIPPIVNSFAPNPVTQWMAGYFGIYVLFTIGIFIFHAMKIANADDVMKEDVPWAMVILLIGTSMLMGLLNDVGTVEMISEVTSGLEVSPNVLMAIMALCGGIITIFSNGLVAAQTLLPLVSAVANGTGASFLPLFVAMYTGTNGPNLSPFSGLGANAVVMASNDVKDKLVKQMFICSFIVLIYQSILALLGVFTWFC